MRDEGLRIWQGPKSREGQTSFRWGDKSPFCDGGKDVGITPTVEASKTPASRTQACQQATHKHPVSTRVPIIKDLTASEGTLFEPYSNGLNHHKNSNVAVESIGIDSNAERCRRRVRRKGPVTFRRKFRTLCKFCNFLGDRRRFARNIYVHMQSGPL